MSEVRARIRLAIGLWVIAAALVFLIVRREMDGGAQATPEPPVRPASAPQPTPARPSASARPSAEPAPVPSSAASVERPTEIEGKDAETWHRIMRAALSSRNAGDAAKALVAIASIDPERFAKPYVLADAVAAVNLAAAANQELEDTVFGVVESPDLGAAGPDMLYRITSIHGGSRAAKRAADLLRRDEVLRHASPALLVAMALRSAPCTERAGLYERAMKEGDDRSLVILQAMRADNCDQSGCCIRNDPKLDGAVARLRERLSASD
jgi:serine/threonine-protein kinase